jgi:PAS domain S-box-containing protein
LENESLKNSVTSFSCVFDQSPVGSAIIGLNRQFLRCNLAFCSFLGYTEDELTGKQISFITYPEDVEQAMIDLEEGKVNSVKIQKRFLRKDSRVIWGELSLCLVLDSAGTPLYFLPVIQDIDKSKQAEKKLIESEERYRRITKGLTDYMYTVIIKNGKAIKTLHNEACISITGYTQKEFNKDPLLWINMVVPEDREMVAERFQSLLEGDDVVPVEHRIKCKNGNIRWICDTALPKYDSTGLIISYDGVMKDITEQKQTEFKLRELEEKYRKIAVVKG